MLKSVRISSFVPQSLSLSRLSLGGCFFDDEHLKQHARRGGEGENFLGSWSELFLRFGFIDGVISASLIASISLAGEAEALLHWFKLLVELLRVLGREVLASIGKDLSSRSAGREEGHKRGDELRVAICSRVEESMAWDTMASMAIESLLSRSGEMRLENSAAMRVVGGRREGMNGIRE